MEVDSVRRGKGGGVVVAGTRCRTWFRHCDTSRKITGSIPVGVNWDFSLT